MKCIYLLLIPMLSIVSCTKANTAPASDPCGHDDSTFRCVKILHNYDGDTITVNIPKIHPLLGQNISVRVNGIDSPEIKTSNTCEKAAGRAAQRLVENLLKNGKRIDLEHIQRDKYFRILADVRVDGLLIKDLLLKNKLAYEYHGGTKEKRDWCQFQNRLPASK